MANRVVISICGEEYTFIAEDSAAYMQKVGSYVSEKMEEVLSGARVGRTDAAVLTAANIADELSIGQEVETQILEIDTERKRISLSIKACLQPEEAAADEDEE